MLPVKKKTVVPTKRRYLCPGCQKKLIWKGHRKGVFSYHFTVNRCRKCARKASHVKARAEYKERRRP